MTCIYLNKYIILCVRIHNIRIYFLLSEESRSYIPGFFSKFIVLEDKNYYNY